MDKLFDGQREREYHESIMKIKIEDRVESIENKKEIEDAMYLLSRMYENYEIFKSTNLELTEQQKTGTKEFFNDSAFNKPPFSTDKRGVIDKESIAKTRKTINAMLDKWELKVN